MVSFPGSDKLESRIRYVEGHPSYIYWATRTVDDFYFEGSQEAISGLNDLPVFSLGSLIVKTGKIKTDFSFKISFLLGADFNKADEQTVKKNHEKYSAYLDEKEEKSRERNSGNYYGDDSDDEYYDSDDDEDNIMRGLSNGDGDAFGF